MKPFKQSNSMKDLLKKLKSHDTLVMAAGVVAATILSGAFVYVTTPAISADAAVEEVRKDSLGVQKKASEQLREIDSYLEKLDQVVTGSQELVKEIQTKQNEINNNTTETKETVTNNTKVVEKIGGLDKELTAIHSEIKATADQVKSLEKTMENGGGKDKNKDNTDFSQINNALLDIKKSCDKSETEVSGLVAQMKTDKNDDKVNADIMASLKRIEEDFGKVNTSETLSRLETELAKTQANYVTLIHDVEKKIDSEIGNVEKTMDKGLGSIEKNVEKTASDVTGACKSVKKIGSDVENANEQISAVSGQVTTVSGQVNTVSEEVENAQNSMTEKLGDTENNVKDKIEGTKAVVTEKIGDMESSMSEKISDAQNSMDEVIGSQQDTDEKLTDIGTSITDVEGSLSSIDERLNEITKKLEESFNKVASEKKQLASTLATLGIDMGDTKNRVPSINEIEQAIKKLPERAVKAAKCEYITHKHVGKNNEVINAEKSDSYGGCFTTIVNHTHGAKCYKLTKVFKVEHNAEKVEPTDQSGGVQHYICGYCRQYCSPGKPHIDYFTEAEWKSKVSSTLPKESRERNYEGGKSYISYDHRDWKIEEVISYKLVCKKNASDIDYFAPSCGHHFGDIIEARIKYDGTGVNLNSSLMQKKFEITDGMILSSRLLSLGEIEEYNEKNAKERDALFEEDYEDGEENYGDDCEDNCKENSEGNLEDTDAGESNNSDNKQEYIQVEERPGDDNSTLPGNDNSQADDPNAQSGEEDDQNIQSDMADDQNVQSNAESNNNDETEDKDKAGDVVTEKPFENQESGQDAEDNEGDNEDSDADAGEIGSVPMAENSNNIGNATVEATAN